MMDTSVPNFEDVVYKLPSRVTFLGEALEPVAKSLRQEIARKVKPSGHEFLIVDDLLLHMDVIHQALIHLSSRLDDLMGNLIQDESAGMAEAYRAAGRLEQVFSEFIDGYHEAKSSHDGPESSEARKLLLGVYRHHIREICKWLDDLVQTIANPASALEKRGITPTADTELTVVLKMTSPPEMAKLDALAKRLHIQVEPLAEAPPTYEPREPPEPRGPGILGTIGGLAFGIGISKAVFGRQHG